MTEIVKLPNADGQLEGVTVPQDISGETFHDLCRIAFWIQVMQRPSGPITAELVAAHRSYPKEVTPKKLKRVMRSAAWQRAGKVMGFQTDPSDALSEEQELALLLLTDPSIKGGFSARLRVAGITNAQYQAWRAQPKFRETMDELGSRLLEDHETNLMTELINQAGSGDVNAIKYAFEVSGKHNPAQQSAIDVRIMLEKVIEIITSEIKDPDTLARIGTRLVAVIPSGSSSSGGSPPTTKEITSGD